MITPRPLLVFLDFCAIRENTRRSAQSLLFCQTWSDAWMKRHLFLLGVGIRKGIPRPIRPSSLPPPIHLQLAASSSHLRKLSLRNISAILHRRGGTTHWKLIFFFQATGKGPGVIGFGRDLGAFCIYSLESQFWIWKPSAPTTLITLPSPPTAPLIPPNYLHHISYLLHSIRSSDILLHSQ